MSRIERGSNMKDFVWKPARGRFASGEELWIGKVCVGQAFYALGAKGDAPKYRAAVHLPSYSMKAGTADWPTLELAKVRVERAVRVWFEWLDQDA
jgi:hypothetical protein